MTTRRQFQIRRKQQRRSISVHLDTYTALLVHRHRTGESMSALVERVLAPILSTDTDKETT